MENDFTKIEEAFKKTPSKIKDALLSLELSENLNKIMKENDISDENADKIIDEIGSVLLGLSPRKLLANSIEKNAGVVKNIALNVAEEIEEKIFKNVLTDNNPANEEVALEGHNNFLPLINKQMITDEQQATKEERRTPEVTSALAAEIGSLIGEKTQGAQRVTYNAGGERVQNMKEQNVEHLTHNVEQNAKTETQIKPEDKLSSVVESPRKEVEMVRRVISENKVTDPYREEV